MIRTRTMTTGDVPAAAFVGAEVGWPGRERRFEFYVRHPLCEALAAEVEGEVAGIGFGTRNGAVGWIGLVCVRPRCQGRGIGRALTDRVAQRLENLGCRTLVLTATEPGRPLYEKMGFSTETHYHGFGGPGLQSEPLHPRLRRMTLEDLISVCELDRHMTGEDRSHLLRALEGPGWVATGDDGEVRGYHLPAPWGGGPTISPDLHAARALVRHVRALAGSGGTARFWLASENESGKEHMREIGFEEARRLPRMSRGEPISWRPGSLWGVFSLGKG